MTIDNGSAQRRLREGLDAAREGNRVLARERLLEAVQADRDLEAAWWALAQLVEAPQERMRALEHVLRLNPSHPEAQQALIGLRQKRLAERDFSQPDWSTLLPDTPLENDDGADDPYQCPYCGRPAGTDTRRCPHCQGQLYARVARQATPGALGLVVLLLGISLGAGLLELAAPLFSLGITQNAAYATTFAPLAAIPWAGIFLGDFMALGGPDAWLLLEILLVRAGLLTAAILGLRQRLTLAYFAAMLVLLADVLVSIYLLITGGLGAAAAGLNLVLALVTATLLVGLSDQFGVDQQRLLVKPDSRAKSALDFYRRGQAYQQRGMWAMAVAQWRKAVGLAPKVPHFYKHLGVGYAQIQRYDRSLRALEEAQRQAPDDTDIPELIRLVQGKADRQGLLR